jgi:Carboxypeptidase regulatory-like domain/TonB-dependent Receptor Plug Domain
MRRHLIWALALGLAAAGLAGAQETTSGSLAGQVVDAQGAPIPGATITITSDRGAKNVLSDSTGHFFAPYLTPGRYAVKVELSGFSPIERKDIQVRLGQRLELAFTMKVGERQEVIEVVGGEPVIDTSSTTTGGVLEADTMKRLPVGRNFTDTLYLVPGVSDSSGVGTANPSVSGASGLDNAYIVDGVNITNVGFGGVGTYSIVFGSLGTGVTQDFIKETQVKTGGFEAEYGQATGGVVNVVTQSGTNAFHGGLFGYFRPSSLESSYNQLQSPNGSVNTTGRDNYDFGATLGGPLIKDKVFFFGAFNPQYTTRTLVAPQGFPLESLGGVDQKRHVLSYAGKATYQATPNHKFEFSAFGDPSKGDLGPQRATALLGADTAGYSTLTSYGSHNQSARYDGIISPNWLVEASVAHATNSINELPSVDTWAVTDRTVTPNARSGGIGLYDQGSDGKNTQYSFKSTNLFNAAGNHQLRYGVQFEDISFLRVQTRTGPTFTLPNGQVTRTGASISITPDPVFGQIYRVTRANYGPAPDTTQKYLNFFAQDTWQLGRLTLRPGVRWERQHLIGGGTKACHVDDSGPGFADGTGALTNCEITWTNLWSPRIGGTYDIMGNGKAKVYASFGRFLSKVPNDLAARALSPDSSASRADYFDAGLTQPIPDGVLAGGLTQHLVVAGSTPSKISPDAKPTYTNEFVGGVEFEVARSMNLGVRWVHRTIPRVMEDYQPASVAAYDIGCPGLGSVEYLINDIGPNLARFNCDSLGANGQIVSQAAFENPVHDYDSFELTATKNFSNNWSLMASYRYAKLKGNFEGFFRSDNGQSDPSITSLFDFPTNDPSYTQVGTPLFGYSGDIRYQGDTLGTGVLPNDRPHQVKIYGTYVIGNLNAGIGFNAGSGAPLTALAANPNYSNSGEIPLTLRGGGLDTVSASGCSACGGFRTRAPALVTFDMHLDYTMRVGKNQRFILSGDAFNLFDNQDPASYDNYTQSSFPVANPNFGLPILAGIGGNPPSYNLPRSIRFGARFEF